MCGLAYPIYWALGQQNFRIFCQKEVGILIAVYNQLYIMLA